MAGSILLFKNIFIKDNGIKSITRKDNSINYKIAELLLKEYEEDYDKLDKNNIKIKYKKSNNEFRVEYTYDEAENVIYTTDFVVYNTVLTTYEEDGTPNTLSFTDTEAISNSTKIKIQELAQQAGYKTAKLLTDKQHEEILNVLKETEIGKYIKEIEENKYKLDKVSSVEKEYIRYYYKKGQKFAEIKCAYNYSKIWSIYITSEKKLNEEYTINKAEYSFLKDEYILDKTITLNETDYKIIKEIIKDYLDE